MTNPVVILSLAVALALILLLGVAGWARASGQISRLPLHLSAWVAFGAAFVAIDRWGRAALRFGEPTLLLGWSVALLLSAVPLVVGLGLARVLEAPPAVRRLLAPYLGVALWVHWGLALLAGRRAAQGAARERERPTSPAASAVKPVAPHEGVRDLAALTAQEIMIPRSEVVGIDGRSAVEQVLGLARSAPHSLYPVHGESVDAPLGVLRMIDLADAAPHQKVDELVRPVPVVPGTMRCLALLPRLAAAADPAAIVVDEFGSVAGFLTIEDLIEVAVGDFVGEHETEHRRITPLPGSAWSVEGTCRVDEFNQVVPLLPEGEYETVAGLFLDRYGRIPIQADEIDLPSARLIIEAVTDRRILRLRIERRSLS
ncbi:MAG: hypothetical protein IT349_17955 [Candidatus Eisenbacteria bacterium]|nr:hypothetical protein [Candidatus Eisenbacteria bacterium]